MKIINWNIARHPLNWVIVTLMVLIAGFAIDIVSRAWKQPGASVTNEAS